MSLSYTNVDRIYDIEPAIQQVSDLTSAHVFLFAQDAEAEVNIALAKNYEVPVAGSPPILQAIATDIAIYRILSRRIFSQERLQESSWPGVFKEARELLADIAKGATPLVNSGGNTIAARSTVAATSNNKTYHPTFSELPSLDWLIDDDKVDDLRDDRDL